MENKKHKKHKALDSPLIRQKSTVWHSIERASDFKEFESDSDSAANRNV